MSLKLSLVTPELVPGRFQTQPGITVLPLVNLQAVFQPLLLLPQPFKFQGGGSPFLTDRVDYLLFAGKQGTRLLKFSGQGLRLGSCLLPLSVPHFAHFAVGLKR